MAAFVSRTFFLNVILFFPSFTDKQINRGDSLLKLCRDFVVRCLKVGAAQGEQPEWSWRQALPPRQLQLSALSKVGIVCHWCHLLKVLLLWKPPSPSIFHNFLKGREVPCTSRSTCLPWDKYFYFASQKLRYSSIKYICREKTKRNSLHRVNFLVNTVPFVSFHRC